MNFAFRVDASAKIGLGHIGRCITLAKKIKKEGHSALFICRNIPANSIKMLEALGCTVVLLRRHKNVKNLDNLYHSSWLGVSQQQDAKDCIEELSSLDVKYDWLIIDHYSLDYRWERELSYFAKKICVIDDLADRKHQCDILIDQNFYNNPISRYSNLVPKNCELLLGPEYAILKDEFIEQKKLINYRDGLVKKIVIFFGGADMSNYTAKAVTALGQLRLKGVEVDVIIGELHPCKEAIEEQCKALNYSLHVQTNCIESFFSQADLCIGGGGVATWERCCLGLPTLIISIAMNQIQIAKDLDLTKGCIYLGDSSSTSKEKIKIKVKELVKDPLMLSEISKKAYSMVDGFGTKRVLSVISEEI
jgi:UDP-2,4-diacetamido-2,4,6-trideoxy-beta-L-altropyranose hydrolase